MKKTCSWLLALAGLLSLAGTTHAGTLPLIPLCLPQLFGQEATAPAAQRSQSPRPSAATETPTGDADWLGDCLADSIELLMEYAPAGRVLMRSLRPCTPYHLAAAAVLEYLAAVDAAQQGSTPEAVASTPMPPCAKSSNCPLAYGTCDKIVYHVGPDGRLFATCTRTACTPCANSGVCCGSCPVDLSRVADACNNRVVCCQAVVQTSTAAKACKCCEKCNDCKNCTCAKPAVKGCKCCDDCKDCKDCTCAKSAVKCAPCQTGPVVIMRHCEGPACAAPAYVPPSPPYPPPPPYSPMAFGFPPPHPLMPPLPPTPFDELRELHMQRQMVTAAIEQIEHELARIEMQKHVVLAPGAQNAHKVHIATEHFEAHCESLHCVGGDPHRVVLEGDVRLVCKKCGQSVRIEAPRVVVNMKDGTFAVESQSPAAVHSAPPMSAMPPVMLWTPNVHWLREPPAPPADMLRPIQWSVPGMPVPTNWHPPVPAETVPMPCPVGPVRPAPAAHDGDK